MVEGCGGMLSEFLKANKHFIQYLNCALKFDMIHCKIQEIDHMKPDIPLKVGLKLKISTYSVYMLCCGYMNILKPMFFNAVLE